MPNQRVKSMRGISQEKEIKRRKKRKKILISIVLITIMIAIFTYLLTSPTFQIKDIEIEGYKQLTQEQIYELSEIKLGDNIFKTLEIVAKVKLKENGYIEDVKIEKIYPDKIKIIVTEREKAYQVLTETGTYINIDEQGYIIDYSKDKQEYILITGMEITEENIPHRLEENDLEKMENILHILDESKEIQANNQIQEIDTKEEYIIHLNNDSLIINFGDATDLKNRMLYVNAILKQEQGNSGTIYVNGNINEGFTPYFSQK